MHLSQRAQYSSATPDNSAGDDAEYQEAEYANLGPNGAQVAAVAGIVVGVMIGLVAAMFAFHKWFLWYRARRCQKKLLEGVRVSESMPLKVTRNDGEKSTRSKVGFFESRIQSSTANVLYSYHDHFWDYSRRQEAQPRLAARYSHNLFKVSIILLYNS